jgi:hypothetical protein
MQGYKNFNYDTISHSNHLEKIRDLLWATKPITILKLEC